MKKKASNLGGILMCLFEILVGILLLVDPVGFTSGIIIAAGAALCLMGLYSAFSYFRTEAAVAAQGQLLFRGLVLLLAGAFCVLGYRWFLATFPVLTFLYGIIALLVGLSKLETAVDAIRLDKQRWYIAAISAILSIVCAVIILKNPFTTTAILWTFTGIALIAEAALDAVSIIMLNAKIKEPKKEPAE